jgi:hypothetical protein
MVGDCVGSSADIFESIAAEIIGAMILGAALAKEAEVENPIKFIFFPGKYLLTWDVGLWDVLNEYATHRPQVLVFISSTNKPEAGGSEPLAAHCQKKNPLHTCHHMRDTSNVKMFAWQSEHEFY